VSDLFREEALAELRGRGGPGDVLRAGPSWLAWSLAALLVLVALGAAAALTIDVREEAHGTATVATDGQSVRAVLPLAFRGEVRPGSMIHLEFDDTFRATRVTSVQVKPAGLVVRTRLVSRLPDGVGRTGRASVNVGSETLVDLLRG
jgi:hypothetical protein